MPKGASCSLRVQSDELAAVLACPASRLPLLDFLLLLVRAIGHFATGSFWLLVSLVRGNGVSVGLINF